MKNIVKSLMVVALSAVIMLSPLGGVTKANAALSDYGLSTGDCYSSTVIYNKNTGYAFYGSVGVTATSGLTYRTIGCTLTCSTTGESRSFKLGDGNRIFKKDSEVSGSTTYTAMIINFNSALDYFPKAKAAYSSNKKLRFQCDSIMTIAINDSNYGAINSDGSNYSQYWVYRDAVGVQNSLSEWYRDARVPSMDVANDTTSYYKCWGSISTFNTYFNKKFTVWNGQPEDTIPVNRGLTNLMGTAKADVKAGDPLTGESGIK